MAESGGNSWGRWGPEDQLGALNLLTSERMLKAFQLVKRAKIYSLAVPLGKRRASAPGFPQNLENSPLLAHGGPGDQLRG